MTLSVSFVKPLPEYGRKGTPVSLLKCNGIEFNFQFRRFGIKYNDIDTVEMVLNLLNDSLVNFDYEGFREINKKHKNIALVFCKEILEKEFNRFIEKSYNS